MSRVVASKMKAKTSNRENGIELGKTKARETAHNVALWAMNHQVECEKVTGSRGTTTSQDGIDEFNVTFRKAGAELKVTYIANNDGTVGVWIQGNSTVDAVRSLLQQMLVAEASL